MHICSTGCYCDMCVLLLFVSGLCAHVDSPSGSMSGEALAAFYSGKYNITLRLKHKCHVEICLWIMERETTNWPIQ